jgi:hypothetical protein
MDMYAGGERDLGPPTERQVVGGQRGEKLDDQGRRDEKRRSRYGCVLSVVAGEGGVDAPEVARASRVHPHIAIIAAHHLLQLSSVGSGAGVATARKKKRMKRMEKRSWRPGS